MLGQEASDGSVTQLSWHPPLQRPPPSLRLSSFQSDPLCPFCLTLKRLQDLGGQVDGVFVLSESTWLGEGGGRQGQLPHQGSPPHPLPSPSYAAPIPRQRLWTLTSQTWCFDC